MLTVTLAACHATAARAQGCTVPAEACGFFNRYLAALNARDWDAFRSTLDDSITVILDVPAPPQRFDGREAAEGMFRLIFPAADAQPRRIPPPIVPLNLRAQDYGSVVVVSFQIGEGSGMARRTVVLHRGPSGWRVVHIHGSSHVAAGG